MKRRSDRPADPGRRRALKLAGAAAVPLVAPGVVHAAAQAAGAPRFFTRDELAMVEELCEIVIPADEHSGGAKAAGVAGYIDGRLAEEPEAAPREAWRRGLKLVDAVAAELHGRPFMQLDAAGREGVVARLARDEASPESDEARFFVELKRQTARAYYTSRIGIHDEMNYQGNTLLLEFAGTDVSEPEP